MKKIATEKLIFKFRAINNSVEIWNLLVQKNSIDCHTSNKDNAVKRYAIQMHLHHISDISEKTFIASKHKMRRENCNCNSAKNKTNYGN
jgi:hypothetical protein